MEGEIKKKAIKIGAKYREHARSRSSERIKKYQAATKHMKNYLNKFSEGQILTDVLKP